MSLKNAIKNGNAVELRRLVKYGASVNQKTLISRSSLLHYAAEVNQPECARILIEAGMDVDERENEMRGYGGCTPLHTAALRGSSAVAVELLKHGATPNITDTDTWRTPLHFCTEPKGNTKIAEALLSQGADMNVLDKYGMTPLRLAVGRRKINMVNFLLSKGADPNAREGNGKTVLDEVAYAPLHDELAIQVNSILRMYGGKTKSDLNAEEWEKQRKKAKLEREKKAAERAKEFEKVAAESAAKRTAKRADRAKMKAEKARAKASSLGTSKAEKKAMQAVEKAEQAKKAAEQAAEKSEQLRNN